MFIDKILFESKDYNIHDVIIKLRKEFIEDYQISLQEINAGYCADFADAITRYFPEIIILGDLDFILGESDKLNDDEHLEPNKFGRFFVENGIVKTEKYNSTPKFSYKKIKSLYYHTWVYHNNKHYDAETPNGVSNFFDLNIYNERDGYEFF